MVYVKWKGGDQAIGFAPRIERMGRPRLYATWKDETLNGMFAKMATGAALGNLDESMWQRIDLQSHLGVGGSSSAVS
eukprot:9493997-Pyramimonas_sp.AAC.1